MTGFAQLHPALQHHIANVLGWRELRPFQDQVISSILAGEHHVILAPTAGGKTEAALFPLLSRMATEQWTGLSILYVCPLRALLNNLLPRIEQYAQALGATAGVWHGDVTASRKSAMLRHAPNVLLTTPESLEGVMISVAKEHTSLLGNVRVVVVDEIHAFAGDDRGWHLLFLLNRIERLLSKPMQRIGLSATVGNPDELLHWLCATRDSRGVVHVPTAASPTHRADVMIDFVGNLKNAAKVVSSIYQGQKRLVFIDSRAKAEELSALLHEMSVDVFLTHGSLSREERQVSEHAFAERRSCVIVATSVLELGVDIGDLDRVIQVNAPRSVAGFLQRMGRTGRREGANRNCLLLATEESELVLAMALLELWQQGYVESATPPPSPLHIAAQQLLALSLQEFGCARCDLLAHAQRVLDFADIPADQIQAVLDWMLLQDIAFEEQGIVSVGKSGESEYGRRHFLDLVSVFCVPPMFTVRHGRQEVGYIDESILLRKQEPPLLILLAGRSWSLQHIDWQRRIVHAEPAAGLGLARWFSEGPRVTFELAQAYKSILTGTHERDWWSKRAKERIAELRAEFAWLDPCRTTLTRVGPDRFEWWTFAGLRGNATLAAALEATTGWNTTADANRVQLEAAESCDRIEAAIKNIVNYDFAHARPRANEAAIVGLKFNECLPTQSALGILADRLRDEHAARIVASQSVVVLTVDR